MMLTELCQELRNWFDRDQPKWHMKMEIKNGALPDCINLKEGQFYRLMGSTFNDGVHRFFTNGDAELTDESEFIGTVWAMAVPPAVMALADEIERWNELYGQVDGVIMSPYTSESFGGYSYTKSSGVSGASGLGGDGWQSAFRKQLNKWRKI